MQCPAKKFQLCYSIAKQNALLVNCSSGWNTHVWTLLSLLWSFDIVKECSEFSLVITNILWDLLDDSSLSILHSFTNQRDNGESTTVFYLKMIHCYKFYASPVISKPCYFELFFHFPWDFEIAGFNFSVITYHWLASNIL